MKEIELKSIVYEVNYDELNAEEKALVEKAKDATKCSYAPYSCFNVGAALLLKNGTVVTGSNQENAAYTNGTCAERNAIFAAQHLYPQEPIIAIAIAASSNGKFTKNPVSPCGACRQVMLEIESRYKQPIKIMLYGTNGIYVIPEGIKALMPLQFVTDSLNDF